MIQKLQHLVVLIDNAVRAQFFEQPFPHGCLIRPGLFFQHRILHPVIKNARRYGRALRMQPLLHLKRRVQVNNELQLQSIIERNRIKYRHPRFIIYDLDIHRILCLGGINAVNPSLKMHPAVLAK